MNHTLAILGAGNMGFAILHGITHHHLIPPSEILAIEPDPPRRARAAATGCTTADHPDLSLLAPCSRLILAVKPQTFPALAVSLRNLSPQPRTVISIMAGLNSASIRVALGSWASVLRAMPNLPCQLGHGVTAIATSDSSSPADLALAHRIFSALGSVVQLEEHLLHAVTAVSGSGPAYLYLLAQAMQHAAEQMEIPAPAARELVTRTILGAGEMLRAYSEKSPADLRADVTSPAGTTAAAIDLMLARNLPQMILDALLAARARAIELAKS